MKAMHWWTDPDEMRMDLKVAIEKCLTNLEACVIVSLVWGGYNQREIAVMIGKSPGRVSQIVIRAFQKLNFFFRHDHTAPPPCINVWSEDRGVERSEVGETARVRWTATCIPSWAGTSETETKIYRCEHEG